jgi:hypothetical protein
MSSKRDEDDVMDVFDNVGTVFWRDEEDRVSDLFCKVASIRWIGSVKKKELTSEVSRTMYLDGIGFTDL